MKNLQQIKSDLWLAASLRNAKEQNYSDRDKKIAKGVESVPVNEVYNQAMYMDKVLLPRIADQRGADSSDYKYFSGLLKTLLWAICLVDRNELMEARYYRLNLQHEILKEHAERLERLFNKYAALEDLFLSSGLDVMAKAVAERSADLLNNRA